MDDIGAIQLAVKVDYTQLTGLIKTTDQTKRAVGLLAKDFARTGDKSQYMSSINKIVMAQNNLSKTSRMSQSAIMSLGAKVVQQTKYTDSLTIATRRLNAAHMASGKAIGNTRNKMNGSNMAVQQLGYQFGDFAVQVQGGTSAFVAFSQQASQLVGVLPMVAGPLGLSMKAAVGLSAALGILIPVGSALGRMFMENRKAAKGAAEGIISIKDASKEAVKEISKLRGELELLQSGAAGSQELALNKAIFEMYNKIYALKNKTVDLTYADAKTIKAVEDAIEGTSTASEKQLEIYEDQLASLLRQRDAIIVNKALAGSEVNEADNEQANTRRRIREEVEAKRKAAEAEKALNLSIVENRIDGITAYYAYEEKKSREKAARDKRVAGILTAKRNIELQSKKNQLLEIELRYGKESTTYKYTQKELSDLELQISQDILKEKLTAQGVDQNAIILAMGLNAQEHELLERRKKLSQISYGLMGGSDAAQRLGKYGGRGTTSDKEPTMGGVSIYDDPKKTQEQKDADALADYIAQLNHEKTVEGELVGLFGSERDIKQKLLDIQHEYDGIITPSQVKQIENTLKLTDAETKRHDALKKAKEEQEALGASIEASMENAFMSIVDGTSSVKDAFKAMAADIIKELFRVLVVKKMVSAISGKLPFADGGVISNGSQVQAYANGGVVGGPTTFAMSGGKTGLMGEAGPEAIMPLKRGANGKLGVQMEGGGGGTTIVQNINVSTGVQQTVRAEIRQMMPQIADSAKGAVLDAKRRGGSYGRAMA